MNRTEEDFIGKLELPKDVLYGIHSLRAKMNFPNNSSFSFEWYKALGLTKLAVFNTYKKFISAVKQKYPEQQLPISLIDDKVIDKMMVAATEVSEGKHYDNFIVPAIQGGAGTSINLNVNEIICNRSLQLLNKKPGNYQKVDPIEHANIFQSTNDVVPTSLKLAIIQQLNILEDSINKLRSKVETLEKQHRNSLRIGYTQMQEAVPSSFGKLFSTYSDALSRDWWRISKCFERIKVVNLGGTAIGTGITVPRFYIMEVVQELQALTKLPLTRGENLVDATTNLDSFVEVHAILKSHAVNLEKMSNDIRLLGSDITSNKALELPQKQVGSSIMPSKVNPVITEYVISSCHRVYSNDMLVSNLSAQGCLELNAYIPVIGHAILDSLELLISANKSLATNLFDDLKINKTISLEKLMNSPAITTALIPYIGYNKATELAKAMKNMDIDISKANEKLNFIDAKKLKVILQPSNLLKNGYTIDELLS